MEFFKGKVKKQWNSYVVRVKIQEFLIGMIENNKGNIPNFKGIL